ncbi:MAG: hypothetical protein EOP83_37345 [Verrucomicrobiaceae bacterium]|nr:MAG: hypothetical protein EOP83_37345 [Verrucomicrobiaceae bacterium]
MDVPNSSLLLFSGNNIDPVGDMSRRIMKIRIDTNMSDPSRRTFPFDPVDEASRMRQQIVAAVLTIVLAYRARQNPQRHGSGSTPSFDQWDEWVRQPICWLAQLQVEGAFKRAKIELSVGQLEDPGEQLRAATKTDPHRLALARLISAMEREIGNGAMSALSTKDILTKASSNNSDSKSPYRASSDNLHAVIGEIFPNAMNGVTTTKLGAYLRDHHGRAVELNGEIKLMNRSGNNNLMLWYVERLNGSAPPVLTVPAATPPTPSVPNGSTGGGVVVPMKVSKSVGSAGKI